MSATREELRQYFQSIEDLILEKFYYSAEGRAILADLLKNNPLSPSISAEFNLPAKYLQHILQQPKSQTRRLTRIAMNLALLQFGGEEGKRIAAAFREHAVDDDVKLKLSKVDFSAFTQEQLDGFNGAFGGMLMKEFIINIGWFEHLDKGAFKKLFALLGAHPTLTTLVLNHTSLEEVSSDKKSFFFEMIEFAKFTSLNLMRNKIGEFAIGDFKKFCDALQASRLVNLSIKRTSLSLTSQKRHLLLQAFLGNFYLQQIDPIPACFSEKEKKEIESALERNKFFHELKLNLDAIRHDLRNSRKKHQTTNDISDMEKRIKIFRQQVKKTGALLAPYATEAFLQGLTTMNNRLMHRAAKWFEGNQAFELALRYYLRVSPKHPGYLRIRFRAFELAYLGHYDEKNKYPAFNAFMSAIACCLDNRNHFIFDKFVSDNRKVFSVYLSAAAEMTVSPDMVSMINVSKRKDLLKFVLIRSLCESISDRLSSHPATLFQAREQRLLSEFLALPPLNHFEDVSTFRLAVKPVWKRACAIAASSPDNMQKILFKAADSLPPTQSKKSNKAPTSSSKMKF